MSRPNKTFSSSEMREMNSEDINRMNAKQRECLGVPPGARGTYTRMPDGGVMWTRDPQDLEEEKKRVYAVYAAEVEARLQQVRHADD